LTVITMPVVVPRSAALGVPDNRPVLVLKLAQDGLLTMLNVSVSLSASLAVGVNEYAWPCMTCVVGVPLIVGARFAASETVIVNAASEAVSWPSLTRI